MILLGDTTSRSLKCIALYLPILDGQFFTYTRREPVGVCAQIIPVSCFTLLCTKILHSFI